MTHQCNHNQEQQEAELVGFSVGINLEEMAGKYDLSQNEMQYIADNLMVAFRMHSNEVISEALNTIAAVRNSVRERYLSRLLDLCNTPAIDFVA